MSLEERFRDLFAGYSGAYGTFEIQETRERDGKKTGRVVIVKQPVNIAIWRNHLAGVQSIGIIPIREDNTCVFGAIDIDDYTSADYGKISARIESNRLPLVATKSKSGGLHLWLFTTEPVPAILVQTKLHEAAAALGYGRSEIFPKQSEILVERGDIGSWINMPYFGGDTGGRVALSPSGDSLSPEVFLDICEIKKVSLQELRDLRIQVKEELADGPPCLQHLITQGFPAGTRNNGLFSLGVYARRAFPDTWESKIEEYNGKYLQPPLGLSEVKEIIKSLKKKEYQYQCSQPPIVHHCNSAVCRGRKYGVGEHSGMPAIGGLTKFNSNPPIWFLDVEGGGRLELDTEDLQSQLRFQRKCMDSLNMMPPPINPKAWHLLVQGLMENVVLIEPPYDASPRSQFDYYLNEFLTSRPSSKREDLVRGKVWLDDEGQYVFRMADLLEYLNRHRFVAFKQNQIASMLIDRFKAKHKFFNVKGKGVNTYVMEGVEAQVEPFTVPEENKSAY